MREVWAIIPAAGEGKRFGNRNDKLMVHLGGLPILVRTVEAVLDAEAVTGAIVVVNPEKQVLYQRMLTEYGHRKPRIYVEGGKTRRESVYRGLQALPEAAGTVLVHDAARPLITPAMVNEAVARVAGSGAPSAIVGVPIVDTVKRTAGPDSHEIAETLDRRTLWRAQTPQVFTKDLLLKAHEAVDPDIPVTDDAQLVELSGLARPVVVPGQESNLKITTPEDLAMAEALLKAARSARA